MFLIFISNNARGEAEERDGSVMIIWHKWPTSHRLWFAHNHVCDFSSLVSHLPPPPFFSLLFFFQFLLFADKSLVQREIPSSPDGRLLLLRTGSPPWSCPSQVLFPFCYLQILLVILVHGCIPFFFFQLWREGFRIWRRLFFSNTLVWLFVISPFVV